MPVRYRRLRQQVKKILDQEEGLTPAKLVKRYPDYVTEHSLRRFKDSVGNPRPRVLHGIRSLVDHWHLDQPVAPGAVAVDECLPSQVPLQRVEPVELPPTLSTTEAPLIGDEAPKGTGTLSRILMGVGRNEEQLAELISLLHEEVALLPRLKALCDEFGV